MLKDSGALFLLPCAFLAALWLHKSAGTEDRGVAKAAAANQELDEGRWAQSRANRRLFLMLTEPILEELIQGQVTLRQASEQRISLARQHYSVFLSLVDKVESGRSHVEKMARNCLRQVEETVTDQDQLARLLPGLEAQLATIVAGQEEK
jgi:hypothetical protein